MSRNIEIERKFVVNPTHPDWIRIRDSQKGKKLIQSTIHKEGGYKLRIRMIEDLDTGENSSFFCFKVNKEKSKKSDPAIRDEFEWPVPPRNALYMMIGHGEITKIRRAYTHSDGLTYEIDEYQGPNLGVITADVEVDDADHTFVKPSFLGWEVTLESKLKNSTLQESATTFATWKPKEKKWYETLYVGDGVVEPAVHPIDIVKEKKGPKSLWKRLSKAWKIIRGKEEETKEVFPH